MMKKIKKAAALKYDESNDMAPHVVASGKGRIAEKIIELARKNNIPLHEDQNLVQVLEALDIDTQISPDLYRAVAQVLVFIYRLNKTI